MWDTRLRSSRLSKGVIGSTLLPLSQSCWAHLPSTPHSKCSRVPRTLLSLAICMFLIFQSINSFPGRHGVFLPVPLDIRLHLLPLLWVFLQQLLFLILINMVCLCSMLYPLNYRLQERKDFFFCPIYIALKSSWYLGWLSYRFIEFRKDFTEEIVLRC